MTMRRLTRLGTGLALWAAGAAAEERFPPPDFESGHKLPLLQTPAARSLALEYLDVAVLLAVLSLASWLALRKRSRRGLAWLSAFSLVYFGFYRKGCVCPIGAIQNVSLALGDKQYVIPLVVVAFFVLPLVFALFCGRTYCSSVCPHGALQDLILVRPVKLPASLEQALTIVPHIYLGLAAMLAFTGSAFIICQYDPFIAIFRMTGTGDMFLLGGGFLLIGMFVGRPYCRFLCPYGALLGLASRVSQWRVTIYPDRCIGCRLCEDSCPYGAIREPTPVSMTPRLDDKRRLAGLLVAAPVVVLACGWLASLLSPRLSHAHPTVRLAERIWLEDAGRVKDTTDASDYFRQSGGSKKELFAQAQQVYSRVRRGAWVWGMWIGLFAGLRLIGLAVYRRRDEWEADRAACVACGRCFAHCPDEYERLQALAALEGETPEGAVR